MYVTLSEISQVGEAYARIALEEEHVASPDQIKLGRRNLELLQMLQFLLVEEYYFSWRTLQRRPVCFEHAVVVVSLAVCIADDYLQHDNILADGGVYILLHVTQVVHEILESVLVKIVEGNLEIVQPVLPFPVTERLQIIAYGLILLAGFLSPVVKFARIGFIFMIDIPKSDGVDWLVLRL